MYQKVIIIITAIAIGLLSCVYISCSNIGTVAAMWGFMYPHLCFVEGTYNIEGESYTTNAYQKILMAEQGQIKVKFKLLELLEERR